MNKKSPVICFASTKGGVGKTSICLSLATYYAKHLPASEKQYRVACVDADPNRTLNNALKLVDFSEILSQTATHDDILNTVQKAQSLADVVLIDLEGSANQAMLFAFGRADLVLIPATPSAFDVLEAKKTFDTVQSAAQLVQRDIPSEIVLSRMPVLKQRVASHTRSLFEQLEIPILPVEVMVRNAFQTMSFNGQPPFMTEPSGGAAANVEALAKAVSEKIGLTKEVEGA